MIHKNNVKLSSMTTFRVGGIANNVYYPENYDELIELVKSLDKKPYWIIGGGSNLLINDAHNFDNVICTKNLDSSMIQTDQMDAFYFGASCRIQHVISFANSYGYGGIEELVSLPATFGGIIYMNAGIGSKSKQIFNISDYVIRVKVLNLSKMNVQWIDKNDCHFEYRHSVFHNNEYIILGAELKLIEQPIEESKRRIDNRRKRCIEIQEYGKGCFGSCCKEYSRRIQKIVRILPIHKKVSQSSKNANWLLNNGDASFGDAIRIINISKLLHKLFRKKFELEIKIWY